MKFTQPEEIKEGMRVRCCYPSECMGKVGTICSAWDGYKYGVEFDDGEKQVWHCADSFERIEDLPVVEEKDCRVCYRKNDVGIKTCWFCGNEP